MKVVILAGGQQSTISREREGVPKPMVDLGGKPLLWHIMKSFSQQGMNDFIICGGYCVEKIKEYFLDFYIYESDITVDLQKNTVDVHKKKTEDWKVTVVDTGLYSSTGQRISQIQKYIEGESFIVTYGDCLSDIDINHMQEVHKTKGKIATLAMAKPTGRSILLPIDNNGNLRYGDKEQLIEQDNAWTNANCFIFQKRVFDYLQGNYDLERQLFVTLSEKKQLATYPHRGFWNAIETIRDLVSAENLWNAGIAPWIKPEQQ